MLRVLIADDNDDMAHSLSVLVRIWGHQPHLATDGEHALCDAAYFRNVAVLDLTMPRMGGLEVARRLRAIPELRGLLLVAMSGYSRPHDLDAASQAGFDHFLTKPYDPLELRHLIEGAAAAVR